MIKYSFKNDYSEGAHPLILEALARTNFIQEDGYSEDNFCRQAIQLIQQKIQFPSADIHFVSGGTQANLIVISSALRPHESVIAASTAHIAVHETGAIEATGHKVNVIETSNGKLQPADIKGVIDSHTDEHMVKPKLVFISNTTEVGTVYSKQELTDISAFCKQHHLLLYLDGARLGSALASLQNNLSLAELATLVDAFYIGGTKNGALLGEAIVITNEKLKTDFRFYLKQKGALLAKGRIFGIQFAELFTNDLFFQLGKHANTMAMLMADGIKKAGYTFLTEPVSNQIFPILPNELIEKLSKQYGFYVWSKNSSTTSVIRLVTSWATQQEFVNAFVADLYL